MRLVIWVYRATGTCIMIIGSALGDNGKDTFWIPGPGFGWCS